MSSSPSIYYVPISKSSELGVLNTRSLSESSGSYSGSSSSSSIAVNKNWIPPLIDPIPLPNRHRHYVIEEAGPVRRPRRRAVPEVKRHFKLPAGWFERRQAYQARDNGYNNVMTQRIKELEVLADPESVVEDQAATYEFMEGFHPSPSAEGSMDRRL